MAVRHFAIRGFMRLASVSVAGGCAAETGSFLDPQGPIAAAQLSNLYEVTAVTMIAVLPVLVLVPLILWRYRYKNSNAEYAPGWDESRTLDLFMWGIPFAIVAFLGVLLWRSTTLLDPYRPLDPAVEATRVQVVGLDWKWLFIYPDEGIATVGELAFPADVPLALELTSDTVMQSLIIGALGGQIYAMPGMQTQLNLSAETPGSFFGENMQYSGEGFHTQTFMANAMSAADYADWLASVRQVAVSLDTTAYSTLAERSTKDEVRAAFPTAVMSNGTVAFMFEDADLFNAIMAPYRGSSAIPPTSQPGSPAYRPLTSIGNP